jgi:uncharacterized membrane protein
MGAGDAGTAPMKPIYFIGAVVLIVLVVWLVLFIRAAGGFGRGE